MSPQHTSWGAITMGPTAVRPYAIDLNWILAGWRRTCDYNVTCSYRCTCAALTHPICVFPKHIICRVSGNFGRGLGWRDWLPGGQVWERIACTNQYEIDVSSNTLCFPILCDEHLNFSWEWHHFFEPPERHGSQSHGNILETHLILLFRDQQIC